jgi:hypothetical protein
MQPFHIDLRELRDRLEPLLDKPPAAPAPGAWAQA